jgi:hypothetical protein
MALSRSGKIRLVLGIVALIVAIGAWQGLTLIWHRGYAHGAVTGVVRKISVHGPPYCKILTGELVYQGTAPGQHAELFHFSVDDEKDGNPIVVDLKAAERTGKPVTLDYRQDVKPWWRCNPSEFFVTTVEK